MTVSVIIPVYNGASYLRAAIDSVVSQRGSERVQLIVVDDGSTDNSAEIASSYGSRLTLIRCDNRGPSRARNIGLAAAQGQYIQFLDADDVLLPLALAKRIARLRNTGASICLSHWHELKQANTELFARHERPRQTWQQFGNEPVVALLNGFWCPPAAWTMQRSPRTNKLRFNERIPLVEDVRFLIDAGLQGAAFVETDQCLALYRVTNAPSLSRLSPRKFVAGVAHNALSVDFCWRHADGINQERRRALIGAYDYASRTLYRVDPKLFHQVVGHLLSLDPLCVTWPAIVARLSPIVGYIRAGDIADSVASTLDRLRQFSHRTTPSHLSTR